MTIIRSLHSFYRVLALLAEDAIQNEKLINHLFIFS